MILETIRMFADALATGSYGVNAQLTSLTYDGSDPRPASITTVADETRNNQVAIGRYPSDYPCLTVELDEGATVVMSGEIGTNNREAEIPVMVRYVQTNLEGDTGNQDAYYTLRAVEKCLAVFMDNVNASDRVRNYIQILVCNAVEHVELNESTEDAFVTGGLRVRFHVRDIAP